MTVKYVNGELKTSFKGPVALNPRHVEQALSGAKNGSFDMFDRAWARLNKNEEFSFELVNGDFVFLKPKLSIDGNNKFTRNVRERAKVIKK